MTSPWLVMLFSWIFQNDLDSLQRSFLHCCSFVMLCDEWSIATNEAQWPSHFSVCNWLLGYMCFTTCLLFACRFCSDWIHAEKFLACFLLCNEWNIATSQE